VFALYFTDLKIFKKLCVSFKVTNPLQSQFFHHKAFPRKALLLHVGLSPACHQDYTTVTIQGILLLILHNFCYSWQGKNPLSCDGCSLFPTKACHRYLGCSQMALFALFQPGLGKSSSLCQDLIPGGSRSALLNADSCLFLFLFFYYQYIIRPI